MRHVLEYHVGESHVRKGVENGREYEVFPVKILVWNDETNTVYEEESEYQQFYDY